MRAHDGDRFLLKTTLLVFTQQLQHDTCWHTLSSDLNQQIRSWHNSGICKWIQQIKSAAGMDGWKDNSAHKEPLGKYCVCVFRWKKSDRRDKLLSSCFFKTAIEWIPIRVFQGIIYWFRQNKCMTLKIQANIIFFIKKKNIKLSLLVKNEQPLINQGYPNPVLDTPIQPVFDVSLFQHIWFKRSAHQQALRTLITILIITVGPKWPPRALRWANDLARQLTYPQCN